LLKLFGEPSASLFMMGFMIVVYALLGAFLATTSCFFISKAAKPAIT